MRPVTNSASSEDKQPNLTSRGKAAPRGSGLRTTSRPMIPARSVHVIVLRDKHLLCRTRCVLITMTLDLLLARINLLHKLDALPVFLEQLLPLVTQARVYAKLIRQLASDRERIEPRKSWRTWFPARGGDQSPRSKADSSKTTKRPTVSRIQEVPACGIERRGSQEDPKSSCQS